MQAQAEYIEYCGTGSPACKVFNRLSLKTGVRAAEGRMEDKVS